MTSLLDIFKFGNNNNAKKAVLGTIKLELDDHQDTLKDTLKEQLTLDSTQKDEDIVEIDKDVKFFNRVFNTAVYHSLINSGAFLTLDKNIQVNMSNLYSHIKHNNYLIKKYNNEFVLSAANIIIHVDPAETVLTKEGTRQKNIAKKLQSLQKEINKRIQDLQSLVFDELKDDF